MNKTCVTCKKDFTTTKHTISKCADCYLLLKENEIRWPEYYKFEPDSVNSFEDLNELLVLIVPHMDGDKIKGLRRFFEKVN